jgi:oligopeptide transport system substrate-binding protein
MLGEWQHDAHLILVKNPTYYDVANVKIDQIYNYMIVEATTAMSMYEAGKLDVLRTIPLEDMDRVKTDPVLSAEFHQADRFCTYYYGFNNEKPPFDNLLVRKAFASAIDRESLITYILKGGQKPAQTFITPRVPGHIDGIAKGIGYPYDPEAARAYLAEAGYPNGEGFPEVTLMFNTSEMHRTIAQFAQQSLMETLDVKVKLANQEWKVYLETCRLDCPQIFRMGWCASYPHGYDYLKRNFYSTIAENNANYKSEEFDRYIDIMESETDPDAVMEAFRGAETLLCDTDCAIVPLFYYTMNELSKSYVLRSFAPTINDIPYFKYWDISSH